MAKNRIFNSNYLILFLSNTIVSAGFFMISTSLSKHLVGMNMPLTVVGSIIGVMSIASMVIRPISGWISDHFKKKNLLIAFLFANVLSMVGYAFARTELQFYLLRIFHGISFGMVTTITMTLVVFYIPQDKIGEGLGYFGLAQTLAMAIGPSIGLFIAESVGNRGMFVFATVLVLLATLMSLYLTDSEYDKEITPKQFSFSFNSIIAKEAIIFGIITIAVASANSLENGYIALYASALGTENIGWYFTLSAVTLLFSRILSGKIMDRKGFTCVLYPGVALIVVSFVVLSLAREDNVAIMFAIAAILKATGVGALQPSLQASAIQSVTPERRGAATSTYYIGTDLGQATAPVVAGVIVGHGGYSFMYLVFTIPLILVCLLFALLDTAKKKKTRCTV